MHKCRPPEKVLLVELGQNKPETTLEQYQAFISAKKICFSLFLVFLENCVCNNSCSSQRTSTNVDKVLIVELGQNKLETMLEQYQAFTSSKNIFFLVLAGPFWKLCLYNNSCTTQRVCTNVDNSKKCE